MSKYENIGIIGAMDEEIQHIKEKMEVSSIERRAGLLFYIGEICGKNTVLVRSGIGKVNAALCAQILIDIFKVDTLINTGVAGAISSELSVGDVVISTDAVQHDMDATIFGDPIGSIPRMDESYFKADLFLAETAFEAAGAVLKGNRAMYGRIASGDQFISDFDAKMKIKNTVKGDCAEMEGAAIAHVCWVNQTPFVIVRSISDKASGGAEVDFQQFVQIAAQNSSSIVVEIIQKI